MLLAVAVAAMASSVVFLRFSTLTPGEISAWRMLLGALCFLPFVGNGWRGLTRGAWARAVLAGLILGLHFVTWVMGARSTSAANASLLVNLVPLVLPFLLLVLAGEAIRRRDWTGSAFGLTGVLVLVGGNLSLQGTWRGDLICLGSMVLLAIYIALSRRAAGLFPGTSAWVVPVFLVSALTCYACHVLAGNAVHWPPAGEWQWIVLLVVCPTLLGHGLMARSLRFWRGQVVGVANGGQFLFAGIYGWFAFGELPSLLFPLGAVLILCGVWLVAAQGRGDADPQPARSPEEKPEEQAHQ